VTTESMSHPTNSLPSHRFVGTAIGSEDDPLSQVDRLIADCKKRIARQRLQPRFRKVTTPRSLYRCCEPLRRAFKGTANSSLIGRKNQGDDDHNENSLHLPRRYLDT